MVDQGMPAPDLLALAEHVARGKYASIRGRHLQAADHYRQAVAIEDRISYMEPPWWYFPVNQSLGAALYRAGRYDEAQQAFTAALAKFPNNGWALYGLAASEQKLGRRGAGGGRARQRSTAPGWATQMAEDGADLGVRGDELLDHRGDLLAPLAAVEDAVMADVLGEVILLL